MTSVVNHFPVAATAKDLSPGDFFTVSYPRGFWVCCKVVSQERDAALVLHSHDPAEHTPFLTWVSSLPETVGKVEGRVTIRPTAASGPLPVADEIRGPGSLSILPDGDLLIRAAGRGGSRDYFSIRDGKALHYLPEEALSYSSWEMVLDPEDGAARKEEPFARFEAHTEG